MSGLFAGAMLVLLGITIGGPQAVELDDAGCPVVVVPAKSVIVLADLTDEVRPGHEQLRAIVDVIERRAGQMAVGDRLSVFALTSDGKGAPAMPRLVFGRCRPRDKGDPMSEDWREVERIFRETWQQPLEAINDRLAAHAGLGSPNTPLMATIKDFALSPLFQDGEVRELVLMSDLLEHDPKGISHYRRPLLTFDEARRQSFHVVDNDGILSGAKVFVLLLSPPHAVRHQSEAMFQFWQDWMDAAGVADYRVNRI